MSNENLKKILAEIVENHGFSHHGFCPLDRPISFPHYQNWIDKGFNGDMEFLSESLPVKQNPREHFPNMRSLVMVGENYFPHPIASTAALSALKTAHYARGQDYHLWLKDKLQACIVDLQKVFPKESFRAFTDSVPLLERDYAYQASLGWVGKNTCLIDREKGSLFFIAEILTSLDLSEESPPLTADFCGTCTRCIEACPTQAIKDSKVLDANLCIAYWTIEAKSNPPPEIRKAIGDWFFGCDICQTVCPWNVKLHKDQPDFDHKNRASREQMIEELGWVLETSNKKLMRHLKDSPLSRAGGRGLKRNALVVIGNQKLSELAGQVKSFLNHERLGELALWALSEIEQDLSTEPATDYTAPKK